MSPARSKRSDSSTLTEKLGGMFGALSRASGGVAAARAGGLAIVYATQVVLARGLSVDSYGVYAYVVAWLSVLVLPAVGGLDLALLRLMPAYIAKAEWNRLRGVLDWSSRWGLLTSSLAAAALVAAAWLARDVWESELAVAFAVGGVAVMLPVTWARIDAAKLRALGQVVRAETLFQLGRPVLLLLLALAAYPWLDELGGALGVALYGLSFLVAAAAIRARLRHAVPTEIEDVRPEREVREWLGLLVSMFGIASLVLIANRVDTLMIGAIIGTEEAGLYRAGGMTAELALFGTGAVSIVLAPQISSMYEHGRLEELKGLVRQAARLILAVTIPIAAALVAGGPLILATFGPAFGEAYWPLVILVAGHSVNALAGPVGFLMAMSGHHRQTGYIMAGAVVVNIVLNAVLIPRYEMLGAAIATSTTAVLWNGALLTFVVKRMGINPTFLSLRLR